MKILHIIGGLGHGGRERRMGQLVKDLSQYDGLSQEIVVFTNIMDYASEIPAQVKITQLNCNNKLELGKLLKSIITNAKPDIVHVWTEVPLVLTLVSFVKKQLNFKLIIGFLADGNIVTSKTARLANKLAFRVSDAIVSNSNAGIIAKKAPQNKSHVIYNGFDFSRFKEFNENALRREFGSEDKILVPMVARFSNAKNWDMFLQVASMVKKQNPKILFLAVGSGEKESEYRAIANTAHIDNVKFLGRRSDVENILRISTVSVLFSNEKIHAEGVSNSIMESMAAGTPVIATRGGGTPEIITDNQDGYIVQPNDISCAVERILELCYDENKRNIFAKNACEKIKDKFLLEGMTTHYMRLYQSL